MSHWLEQKVEPFVYAGVSHMVHFNKISLLIISNFHIMYCDHISTFFFP